MKIVCAIVALILSAYLPAFSDTMVNIDPLPNTGTYFIINSATHYALQPGAPSLGQSVFLKEYNRSGTQQWVLTRKFDPVTNQPTNRYTIRLAGEARDLNFQPHPSVSSMKPIIGLDSAVYAIEPSQGGFLVKSVEKNGDAMYSQQSSGEAAPAFAANDGSTAFLWNFLPGGTTTAAVPTYVDPLPMTGTYYIINAASNEALQPNGPSSGQNVFVVEFNRGGTQKWAIDRKIDPVTNQPTNRYTIKLAGEAGDLNLQPHPSIGDATPIVGLEKAVYTLEPSSDGLVVKSVSKNGDAMFLVPQSGGNAEAHFGADDGSKKFRWNFVRAN